MPQTISDARGARTVRRTGRTLWVGDVRYTWDAAGRLVGKGEWTYAYGASGQLETAQRPGRTVTYVYDETGARLLKRVDGVPVRAEVAGGVLTEDHFVELVEVGGVVAGVLDNGAFTALLTDPRGTPFAGPDGTPGLATPYGVRTARLGHAEVIDYARLGWDPDLDTVRMGVRDYDAALGQFWTPDPLYLESLEHCAKSPIDCNLYGYAKGNPLSWVDPAGTNPRGVQMIQTCDECGSLSQSRSIEGRYTSVGLENGSFKIGYLGQDGQSYVHSVPMKNLGGGGAGGLIQLPGNVIAPRLWNDASSREISAAMSMVATVYGDQANGAIAAMQGFDLVLAFNGALQTAKSVFRVAASPVYSNASAAPTPSTSAAPSGIQANKAAGDAWSQAVGAELKATEALAVPEITLRTQSGVRTRMDWVTRSASGTIRCIECKASATAPLTRNQAAAFPEIAESGAVVVGKGKPGMPGGTVIPPTVVEVRRP
jgi:RHS repeat-associated protein